MQNYIRAWKKSFVYEGRATRSEFWHFVAIHILIFFSLGMLFFELAKVYNFVSLAPHIALTIRRMHDLDKTGWLAAPMYLMNLSTIFPFFQYMLIYALLVLAFFTMRGTIGSNKYGKDPLLD